MKTCRLYPYVQLKPYRSILVAGLLTFNALQTPSTQAETEPHKTVKQNSSAACTYLLSKEILNRLSGTSFDTKTLKILLANTKGNQIDLATLPASVLKDLYLDWEWASFHLRQSPAREKSEKASWIKKKKALPFQSSVGKCEEPQPSSLNLGPLTELPSSGLSTQIYDLEKKGLGMRSPSSQRNSLIAIRDHLSELKSVDQVGLKESQVTWKKTLVNIAKDGGFTHPPQYWEEFDNFFDPLLFNYRQCKSGSFLSLLGPHVLKEDLTNQELASSYFEISSHHIRPAHRKSDGSIEVAETTSLNAYVASYESGEAYCKERKDTRFVSLKDALVGELLLHLDNYLQSQVELPSPENFVMCTEDRAATEMATQSCQPPKSTQTTKNQLSVDELLENLGDNPEKGNSIFGGRIPEPPKPRKKLDPNPIAESHPKDPGYFGGIEDELPPIEGNRSPILPQDGDSPTPFAFSQMLQNPEKLSETDRARLEELKKSFLGVFPKSKSAKIKADGSKEDYIHPKLLGYVSTGWQNSQEDERESLLKPLSIEKMERLSSRLPDLDIFQTALDPQRQWTPERVEKCQFPDSNCTDLELLMNELYTLTQKYPGENFNHLSKQKKVDLLLDLVQKFEKVGIRLTANGYNPPSEEGDLKFYLTQSLDKIDSDNLDGWAKNIFELAPSKRKDGSFRIMGYGDLNEWEEFFRLTTANENSDFQKLTLDLERSMKHKNHEPYLLWAISFDYQTQADPIKRAWTLNNNFHTLTVIDPSYSSSDKKPSVAKEREQEHKAMKNLLDGTVKTVLHQTFWDIRPELQLEGLGITFVGDDQVKEERDLKSKTARDLTSVANDYPAYLDILKAFSWNGMFNFRSSKNQKKAITWNDATKQLRMADLPTIEAVDGSKPDIPSAFELCRILKTQKVSESNLDAAQGTPKQSKKIGTTLKQKALTACKDLIAHPSKYLQNVIGAYTSFKPKDRGYGYSINVLAGLEELRPDLKEKIKKLKEIHPGEMPWEDTMSARVAQGDWWAKLEDVKKFIEDNFK